MTRPVDLGVSEAAHAIREGRLTAVELTADCLSRVREVDRSIEAWAFLDSDHALRQAEAADAHRMAGRPLGLLHGVPVGIKDIFDTADYPTEFGSTLWQGRTPRQDAIAVARLRAAGAIVLGKTVTTEYAYYHPGKTRNPHDPARTPGGSSSGSAAAVAAGMVPGAIGSQTNGSVIRPASFCGVVGFKPTHGLIPRTGAMLLSRALDHVGVFARSVVDAALLADVLSGHDDEDPDTRPIAIGHLASSAAGEPPLPPRFAFVKGPAWQAAEPVLDDAFGELVAALGENVQSVDLGASFERGIEFHGRIMAADMAHNFRRDLARGGDVLSAQLRELLARGKEHTAYDYLEALSAAEVLNQQLDDVFNEYDAILTASAPGEAPVGMATGNPIFCSIWTYLGTPAISLPLLAGQNELPIGVQLVARRGHDARLLRTARWLSRHVASESRSRKSPTSTAKGSGRRANQRRAK
jgi:Asp-tRNA(Asn)/Glu-tRNA(Gln) amidotransferase A subunit family amidase